MLWMLELFGPRYRQIMFRDTSHSAGSFTHSTLSFYPWGTVGTPVDQRVEALGLPPIAISIMSFWNFINAAPCRQQFRKYVRPHVSCG